MSIRHLFAMFMTCGNLAVSGSKKMFRFRFAPVREGMRTSCQNLNRPEHDYYTIQSTNFPKDLGFPMFFLMSV